MGVVCSRSMEEAKISIADEAFYTQTTERDGKDGVTSFYHIALIF